MKRMMCIMAFIMAFMLVFPLSVLGKGDKILPQKTESNKEAQSSSAVKEVKADESKTQADVFRVLNKESGQITEMSASDYIFCVVAAEMPALYHTEALKAQAVAAYTYACYKRERNKDKSYDITTDYRTDQSFKTKAQACEDWGSNAQKYVEKTENAVKQVIGEKILYKGNTILSVYHAVSCGTTYAAEEVWGGEYPYLKSVPSAGDKLAANYLSEAVFTKAELKEKISDLAEEKKSGTLISELKASKSGLVESLKVYGQEVSGSEIRSALNLPSSNFEYTLKNGKYTFYSYGYGHGVGMSQYGADYMAKNGYTYDKILMHYYTDCSLEK